MKFVDNIYNKFSHQLSRTIEARPRLLKLYKWFCFKFLKPNDLTQTPIFINNRNHYTYLKELIGWLENNGFQNYYVIDNDSSYPPLLAYYQNTLKERVILLKRNVGHLSFWKEDLLSRVKHKFYVYTDADILPEISHNPEFISQLYSALKKHHFAMKAGSAIQIDDLPACYSLRDEVVRHEESFWKKPLDSTSYHATVDTTLALYLPNYHWEASNHWDKHIRVAGKSLIKHQPWYQNSENLDEEQKYYKNHSVTATHWTVFETSPCR